MFAVLIGFLLVTASAAAFGAALFGRRPVPQVAMDAAAFPRDGEFSPAPAAAAGMDTQATTGTTGIGRGRILVDRGERLRAALILFVASVGTAVLLGAVLAIVVVAAVLLVA